MKIIKTKRIYDKFEETDGTRILVDRLWPRGIKKEQAQIDLWMKDIAPSDSLRKWFNHDPKKWKEFRDKYFDELSRNKKLCYELINWGKSKITLIYSAKDKEHNNAVLLQEYLEKDFKKT